MARPEKVAKIEDLKARMASNEAAILVDFRGLNVSEISKLRRSIRDAGGQLRVVKNTLFRIALAGTEAEALAEFIVGPTGVVFCADDIGSPAKVLIEFQSESGLFAIKAAWADRRIHDAAQVVTRSRLPGRTELIGQLAGVLHAPLAGLARSMNGMVVKLARALNEVAALRGEAA